MNLTHLLFSLNGRISRQDFWVGILLLAAANIVAGEIPFIGWIFWLGLIYVGACIYVKRLHDAGKTGWLHAIPWAVWFLALVLGLILGGGAILSALMSGGGADPAAILAAGGVFVILQGVPFLVWLAYTIWVGVLTSEPGVNAYGAPPSDAVTAAAAQPAAPVADRPQG